MTDTFDVLGSREDPQRWVDQLVDGELNDERQRQALLALEAQPDGWRKCALAFIEAQTLRRELRGMIAEPAENGRRIAAAGRNKDPRPLFLRWLAIAACLVIAFALGTMTQSGKPLASAVNRSEKSVAVASVPGVQSARPTKVQTFRVTLPTADGQTEQSLEVPMVEGSENDLQSMLAQKQIPMLSDVAIKALESTGHEVQQHRAYYPVQLEDGRQGVVPMDLVEVRETSDWQ